MAGPSVSYTFSNSTTADASQVNSNFTDLINGLTDGTKDLSIAALTCAGTATFNGAVTLGNATGDDITFTGYVASDVLPKTTNASDLGGAGRVWAQVHSTAVYATNIEPISTAGLSMTGSTDGSSAATGKIGEFKQAACSATTESSGTNTYTAVTGMTFELTAGEWLIGYDVLILTGTGKSATIAILDGSAALVANSNAFVSSGNTGAQSVSRRTVVRPTANTTYYVKIRSEDTSANARVYATEVGVAALSEPENASVMWALRIR